MEVKYSQVAKIQEKPEIGKFLLKIFCFYRFKTSF